MTGVKAHGKR